MRTIDGRALGLLDDSSLAPQASLQNDHIPLTSWTKLRSSSKGFALHSQYSGDEFKENIYV
jgi:hypothetical protein